MKTAKKKAVFATAAKAMISISLTLSIFCTGGKYASGKNYSAEEEADSVYALMADSIETYISSSADVKGKIRFSSLSHYRKDYRVYFSRELSEYKLTDTAISRIYSITKHFIPEAKSVKVFTDGHELNELKSYFDSDEKSRNRFSKTNRSRVKKNKNESKPLVREINGTDAPEKGLASKHIALWQSHGYYYEQSADRWEWQRARIHGTVEDLYTQSYVLPYLVPMLENAGAYVLLPKERDLNKHEIIVDNDDPASGYSEKQNAEWSDTGIPGFADTKGFYTTGENPFAMGTARKAESVERNSKKKSSVSWTPSIPENGTYAVYVSYQSLPESTDEALYTVRHQGGENIFSVNQKMGGGTWIYLGSFPFRKGKIAGQGVELSNANGCPRSIVTADAVKFGGGMGNIARSPYVCRDDSSETPAWQSPPRTSGYPRACEAARYWLQWAGFADSIYTDTKNTDDYTDDYVARGKWVNAISGGSSVNRKAQGYGIPVDLALAFHSDAGTKQRDSIVGTLAIYMEKSEDKNFYPSGAPRLQAREYADIMQTQIVNDIRKTFNPKWTRRGLWNRSYAEARRPDVPTVLIELLSHQNIADMAYGLNPEFQFVASRAVYKGVLKYLSLLEGKDYAVQPLPVRSLSAVIDSVKGKPVAKIEWTPAIDPLEPTAVPDKYIVYTKISEIGNGGETDGGAFDNGFVTCSTKIHLPIESGKLYSYKIVAVNEGGKSFPSETLSIGLASSSGKSDAAGKQVLIINAFTKASGPGYFGIEDSLRAGFEYDRDFGVPYMKNICFTGYPYEFRRTEPWKDDDAPGFGASYYDYETTQIAGNTFDYPAVHGKALMNAGYSFCSASRESIENGTVDMTAYRYADVILGKQSETLAGYRNDSTPVFRYPAFTYELAQKITGFCRNGGNILVSGAYAGSDIWNNPRTESQHLKNFASQVLKYKHLTSNASKKCEADGTWPPAGFEGHYSWNNSPNPEIYHTESVDGILPSGENACTIFRYSDSRISAAIAYDGDDYKTVVFGFPIEALGDGKQIEKILGDIMNFFGNSQIGIKIQ